MRNGNEIDTRKREMNQNKPSIRQLGQRSIPSTFIFSSSNRSIECKKTVENKASNEKGPRISLSEFLNRKLQTSSVLPGSAQGKERQFSSPVGCKDVNCAKGEIREKEKRDGEKDFALDIALRQFMHTKTEKENVGCFEIKELGSGTRSEYETQGPGKRKRGDFQESAKKLLAVLGDDTETKRGRTRKSVINSDKPKPLFNHYANGGGWWDCNMEGVDNEEVGSSEVWEGMGSTTLGGLDWH